MDTNQTMEKNNTDKNYIAIDLKSFYASVECVERGLDPLTTNLVVADPSRTEKTICLAVSPSLKAHGISGRARLFEVVQRVREVNADRLSAAVKSGTIQPGSGFTGSSYDAPTLAADPSLQLTFITAPLIGQFTDGHHPVILFQHDCSAFLIIQSEPLIRGVSARSRSPRQQPLPPGRAPTAATAPAGMQLPHVPPFPRS